MPAHIGIELVVLLCTVSTPPAPPPPPPGSSPSAQQAFLDAIAIHRQQRGCTEITLSVPHLEADAGNVPEGVSARTIYDHGKPIKRLVYARDGITLLFSEKFDSGGNVTHTEMNPNVDFSVFGSVQPEYAQPRYSVVFSSCLLAQWPITNYLTKVNPTFGDPSKWRVDGWRCNLEEDDDSTRPPIGSDKPT